MADEYSYIPLWSVALGGGLTFIATAGVEWLRTRKKGKTIECALIAEIKAMLEINKARRYQEGFAVKIKHLEKNPEEKLPTQIKTPPHYSRIYQQNASDIGLINKELAAKIVKFHQFVDSVIQDVTEGGVLYEGASVGTYNETNSIYTQALYLGEEIIREYSTRPLKQKQV